MSTSKGETKRDSVPNSLKTLISRLQFAKTIRGYGGSFLLCAFLLCSFLSPQAQNPNEKRWTQLAQARMHPKGRSTEGPPPPLNGEKRQMARV